MFQRDQIEKLLALNGVHITASDDEIKSVLFSARWHKDDVEAAMIVLRENKITHETYVDSLHKVFRTDERLRPETVSALLGIHMDISSEDLPQGKGSRRAKLTSSQLLNIALVSLTLSVIFVLSSMWFLQMGLFHQTLR